MSPKLRNIIFVVIALALLGVGGYAIFRDNSRDEIQTQQDKVSEDYIVPDNSLENTTLADYEFISPAGNEQWQANKEYVIKWKLPAKGRAEHVTLAVINRDFEGYYRYNICEPTSPYSCELPDTGEFRWLVPPDDGHNEWAQSNSYQIMLERPTEQSMVPFSVSNKFSIIR